MIPVFLEAIPGTLPSPSPSPAIFSNVISVSFFCSTMIWAPVLMALLISTLPSPRGRYDGAFRWIAFWTLVGLLVLNLLTYSQFATFGAALQFEEKLAWLPRLGAGYHLGLDGMGMGVLLLSSIVGVAAAIASWNVRTRQRAYFALLLLLQAAVNGVVCSHDLFLFALFLSSAVLPAALLVLGWGGPLRVRAGTRLLGYWAVGAAAFWVAVLLLYGSAGAASFDMDVLLKVSPSLPVQLAIAAALVVAAACWLPLVPFHSGVRDALAEAPAGVGVLLAGSVTRLGGYLLLRVLLLGPHEGAVRVGSTLAGLAAATAIYVSVLALLELRARGDLRRAAAALALLPGAMTALAVAGQSPMAFDAAIFALYAGGLAAALLVGAAATTAERAGTRSLAALGGIGLRAPVLTWLVVIAALAVLGIPGFASYLAWLMTLLGSIRNEPGGTFGVLAGLVLGAVALAGLVWRIGFAPPAAEGVAPSESTLPERWYLGVLAAALIWVGIVPSGPKLPGAVGGQGIFDPGYVNVINASTSDEAGAYAVPVPRP